MPRLTAEITRGGLRGSLAVDADVPLARLVAIFHDWLDNMTRQADELERPAALIGLNLSPGIAVPLKDGPALEAEPAAPDVIDQIENGYRRIGREGAAVPAVAPPAAPATVVESREATVAAMMAAATPKTAPAGRCEQLEAAIASRQSRIEADVLAELSHDWRPLTEVRPAVRARGKGGYGYGQAGIEDAIGRLMAAGRVEKAGPGGRPSTTQSGYRTIRLAVADLVPSRDWRPRPTASSPAGERPDRLALIRRACVAVLNDGAAHDFKALSDASPPTASFEQVRAVLGELVRSGQVGIRSVGLERRYQRRPEIACVT